MPEAHLQHSAGVSAVQAWASKVGPMTEAMVQRLIEANPVRELTPVRKKPARPKVALTEEALDRMRSVSRRLAGRTEVRPRRHRRSGLAADQPTSQGRSRSGTVIWVPAGEADRPAAHEVLGEHAHDHAAEMADGVDTRAALGFARAVGVPVDGRDIVRPVQHP